MPMFLMCCILTVALQSFFLADERVVHMHKLMGRESVGLVLHGRPCITHFKKKLSLLGTVFVGA
jgi:hypothetical protein